MTWIRTIPKSQADDAYRAALEAQHAWYPQEYAEQVPGVPANDGDGIVAALSLIPNALHHHFATFGSLMDPALPLSRRQHELIATVVSQANCTRYCSVSHREFLRRATGDAALVDAVQQDFRTAPLTDASPFDTNGKPNTSTPIITIRKTASFIRNASAIVWRAMVQMLPIAPVLPAQQRLDHRPIRLHRPGRR